MKMRTPMIIKTICNRDGSSLLRRFFVSSSPSRTITVTRRVRRAILNDPQVGEDQKEPENRSVGAENPGKFTQRLAHRNWLMLLVCCHSARIVPLVLRGCL